MSLRQKFISMPRQPTAEPIAREPQPQPDTTAATTNDWSGWERWLRGHVAIELKALHTALGQVLADEREKFERKTNEFEIKIAKLAGAVDVLRGVQPPPPAKFPSVKAWTEDVIYHEGDIVTFAGGTWQAQRDTARPPGTKDWICLADAGAGFTMRGTYASDEKYSYLDVVIINGSSFAALKDNPGRCPDSGDWHLLASRGSRGNRGESGARGMMGLRGERGAAAPTIQSWMIDRARYTATPMMSDGSIGPSLELRGLFEQFFTETTILSSPKT
jgi:hypothetical protein